MQARRLGGQPASIRSPFLETARQNILSPIYFILICPLWPGKIFNRIFLAYFVQITLRLPVCYMNASFFQTLSYWIYSTFCRGLEALHADRDTQVHIIAFVLARGLIGKPIRTKTDAIWVGFPYRPTPHPSSLINSQTSGSALLESCCASEKSEGVEWKV